MKKPVGRVYILTNQAMPGLVKIGFTKNSVEERVRELFTTGVPSEFKIEFQIECRDPEGVEQAVHEYLTEHRHQSIREFFRTNPKDAAKIISEIANKISEEIFEIETNLITNEDHELTIEGKNVDNWIRLPSPYWHAFFSKNSINKIYNNLIVWEKYSYNNEESLRPHMSSLIKKQYFLNEGCFSILHQINFKKENAEGDILNLSKDYGEKVFISENIQFEMMYKFLINYCKLNGY